MHIIFTDRQKIVFDKTEKERMKTRLDCRINVNLININNTNNTNTIETITTQANSCKRTGPAEHELKCSRINSTLFKFLLYNENQTKEN